MRASWVLCIVFTILFQVLAKKSIKSGIFGSGKMGSKMSTSRIDKHTDFVGTVDGKVSNSVSLIAKSIEVDKNLSPASPPVRLFKKVLTTYNSLLETHPYLTKMITSGLVSGLGDVLVQLFDGGGFSSSVSLDYRRVVVMMMVGSFFIAPFMHNWFNLLFTIPVPKQINNNIGKATMMIALDQILAAPFVIAGFFISHSLASALLPPYPLPLHQLFPIALQGGAESVRDNLFDSLIMNWRVWPVINFVNFAVVPLQFRVLFANIAAVFWNMYLSKVANE